MVQAKTFEKMLEAKLINSKKKQSGYLDSGGIWLIFFIGFIAGMATVGAVYHFSKVIRIEWVS